MEEYDYISTLGEGAYGYVWKCQERSTGRIVAIKGFKQAHEEPEIMKLAVREVRVLQALDHPAVIKLIEAFKSKSGRVYMVFPYVGRSAYQELDHHPRGLPPNQLKLLVWQLLQALWYLHNKKIVHRDIKPANILLSEAGDVKLCDFGFARHTRCGPRDVQRLSTYVVTRWYRAPELLVSDVYGPAADIWSLGCTVAELATGQPLFPGKSTADQLWRIIRCFGPLAPPQHARLAADPRLADAAHSGRGRSLRDRLPGCDPGLFRLLEACLQMDPAKRPVASELLQMPYFWSVPKLLAGSSLEAVYHRLLAAQEEWEQQAARAAVVAQQQQQHLHHQQQFHQQQQHRQQNHQQQHLQQHHQQQQQHQQHQDQHQQQHHHQQQQQQQQQLRTQEEDASVRRRQSRQTGEEMVRLQPQQHNRREELLDGTCLQTAAVAGPSLPPPPPPPPTALIVDARAAAGKPPLADEVCSVHDPQGARAAAAGRTGTGAGTALTASAGTNTTTTNTTTNNSSSAGGGGTSTTAATSATVGAPPPMPPTPDKPGPEQRLTGPQQCLHSPASPRSCRSSDSTSSLRPMSPSDLGSRGTSDVAAAAALAAAPVDGDAAAGQSRRPASPGAVLPPGATSAASYTRGGKEQRPRLIEMGAIAAAAAGGAAAAAAADDSAYGGAGVLGSLLRAGANLNGGDFTSAVATAPGAAAAAAVASVATTQSTVSPAPPPPPSQQQHQQAPQAARGAATSPADCPAASDAVGSAARPAGGSPVSMSHFLETPLQGEVPAREDKAPAGDADLCRPRGELATAVALAPGLRRPGERETAAGGTTAAPATATTITATTITATACDPCTPPPSAFASVQHPATQPQLRPQPQQQPKDRQPGHQQQEERQQQQQQQQQQEGDRGRQQQQQQQQEGGQGFSRPSTPAASLFRPDSGCSTPTGGWRAVRASPPVQPDTVNVVDRAASRGGAPGASPTEPPSLTPHLPGLVPGGANTGLALSVAQASTAAAAAAAAAAPSSSSPRQTELPRARPAAYTSQVLGTSRSLHSRVVGLSGDADVRSSGRPRMSASLRAASVTLQQRPPALQPQPLLPLVPSRPGSTATAASGSTAWLAAEGQADFNAAERLPSYVLGSTGGASTATGMGTGAPSCRLLAPCNTVLFEDCASAPSASLARLRAGLPAPNPRAGEEGSDVISIAMGGGGCSSSYPYSYGLFGSVVAGSRGGGADSAAALRSPLGVPDCPTPSSVQSGQASGGQIPSDFAPGQPWKARLAPSVAERAGTRASTSAIPSYTAGYFEEVGSPLEVSAAAVAAAAALAAPSASAFDRNGPTAITTTNGSSGGGGTTASIRAAAITGRRSHQYSRQSDLPQGTQSGGPRSARLAQVAASQVQSVQQQQQQQVSPYGSSLSRPSVAWAGTKEGTQQEVAVAPRRLGSVSTGLPLTRMKSLPEVDGCGGDDDDEDEDDSSPEGTPPSAAPVAVAAAAAGVRIRGARRSVISKAWRAAAAAVGAGGGAGYSSSFRPHSAAGSSGFGAPASGAISGDDWCAVVDGPPGGGGVDTDLGFSPVGGGVGTLTSGKSVTGRGSGLLPGGAGSARSGVLLVGGASKVAPAPINRSRFSGRAHRESSTNGNNGGSSGFFGNATGDGSLPPGVAPSGLSVRGSQTGGLWAIASTSLRTQQLLTAEVSAAVVAIADAANDPACVAGSGPSRQWRRESQAAEVLAGAGKGPAARGGGGGGDDAESGYGGGGDGGGSGRQEDKKGSKKKGALSKIIRAVKRAFVSVEA